MSGKFAHGVWTGDRAIFLYGRSALAYSPASRDWQTLPDIPPNAGTGVVVWTGERLFVWGGGREGALTNTRGAMFEPATDRWVSIAPAPFGLNLASGGWTGDEVIVFGSLRNNRNIAPTRTSVGEAYDPSTGHWRELPASRLSRQATSAVWLGRRMLAWDYEGGWQLYDSAAQHLDGQETDALRAQRVLPRQRLAHRSSLWMVLRTSGAVRFAITHMATRP
ncbi:MAG: hypothetical protein ACXVQU_04500 [Actinomycetota bacterium]